MTGPYCGRCHADHSTPSKVSSRSEDLTDDRVVFDRDEVDGAHCVAQCPGVPDDADLLGGVTRFVAERRWTSAMTDARSATTVARRESWFGTRRIMVRIAMGVAARFFGGDQLGTAVASISAARRLESSRASLSVSSPRAAREFPARWPPGAAGSRRRCRAR